METGNAVELRRTVINSVADEPKSTKSLQAEFVDLGDRKEASAFLGSMHRLGLIEKKSNGYWKPTVKGLRYAEAPPDSVAATEVSQDAPGTQVFEHLHQEKTDREDTVSVESEAELRARVGMQQDQIDDLRIVLGMIGRELNVSDEPHQTWMDRVIDAARAIGAPTEVKPPRPSESITALQDGIPEDASLVIQHHQTIAVIGGQQFEIKDPGDYEAFVRVAARFIGGED